MNWYGHCLYLAYSYCIATGEVLIESSKSKFNGSHLELQFRQITLPLMHPYKL
jgi:hypothetical protein